MGKAIDALMVELECLCSKDWTDRGCHHPSDCDAELFAPVAAALREAREEMRERCAEVCKDYAEAQVPAPYAGDIEFAQRETGEYLATTIRTLPLEPEEAGK